MTMIFQDFDKTRHAFINPQDSTKPVAGFPKLCVTTFSEGIIQKFARMEGVKTIAHLYSANGVIPVYEIKYEGSPVAFFLSRVGAPACAAGLEEIIAMGSEKLVMFGCAGVLDSQAVQDKIVIPTAAVRDEGTSCHYLPASEEIYMEEKSILILKQCLDKHGIPWTAGKTWTTDAIYRETHRLIEKRKEQGCITVEMECSAALAVTRFRKVSFIQFLYGADDLDGESWSLNNLLDYGLEGSEKYMALAFECAISM